MSKITIDRAVAEQALEALLNEGEFRKILKPLIEKSIDSIREALDQPDAGIPATVPAGWKLVPVVPTDTMLAAAPKPPVAGQMKGEQDPVAWGLYCADKLCLVGINRHPLDGFHSDWSFRPLYTHSQPPRQPLTDEQIDGIIRDLDPSWLDTPTGFEEEFCRAIEHAHGIGGEA